MGRGGRPVRRTGTVQTGSELVQVGLADEDRACRDQVANHGCRLLGAVGERRARRRRRPPLDVHVVFDREGDAPERKTIAIGRIECFSISDESIEDRDPDSVTSSRIDRSQSALRHIARCAGSPPVRGVEAGDLHARRDHRADPLPNASSSADDSATAPKTPPCMVIIFSAAS